MRDAVIVSTAKSIMCNEYDVAVAGCAAEEMGIGPVFAIPRLLNRQGLSIDDIGLWELNEAFACQVIYCRDKLGIGIGIGIDNEKLNVNGGAISTGHPFGMSGARMVGDSSSAVYISSH